MKIERQNGTAENINILQMAIAGPVYRLYVANIS